MSRRLDSLKEVAYKEALKCIGRQRHGAVVIGNGGRILAKACNNYKNGYHAEARAIKRVPHDAKASAMIILVVRAARNKRFGLSRPCRMCQKTIREAKIKIVYFSTGKDELLGLETYGD